MHFPRTSPIFHFLPPGLLVTHKRNIAESRMLRKVHMLIYQDPIKKGFQRILLCYNQWNIFLGVSMLGACTSAFPEKKGGIRVLAGQALCSQTVWLLIESPEKIQQMWVRQIYFNGKIHSTTFDQINLAKSKIWQSRILPFHFAQMGRKILTKSGTECIV